MSTPQIMIVEDERIIAVDIQKTLQGFGYGSATIASTGEEAIRKADEMHPDLVLMDIFLKGTKDGIEVAEHLRRTHDTPVIFLTAYADPETINRAKTVEPYGYILKPLNRQEVHSSIELALYKHRMERLLKLREQWLRTVLRDIGDAVITTDADGKIEFMNPAAEELTGYDEAYALGKELVDIYEVRRESGRGTSPASSRLPGDQDRPFGSDRCILVRRDGEERRIDESISSLRDGKNSFAGFVLIFRDITRQAGLEEESRRQERLRAIQALSAGVGHHFKEILESILSVSNLIEHRSAELDAVHSGLKTIKSESQQGMNLVQQLLLFGRDSRIRFEPIDPADLATRIRDILGQVLSKDISLSLHVDPTLSSLEADPAKLIQALVNLSLNAQDAMPEGGMLTISMASIPAAQLQEYHPEARVARYLHICISDTGSGMDSFTREHMFDPFFTTRADQQRAGLGASVAQGIIEQHDGFISVKSQPGRGTTISVYLPIDRKA